VVIHVDIQSMQVNVKNCMNKSGRNQNHMFRHRGENLGESFNLVLCYYVNALYSMM
jgi:hypothetical protein